MWPFQFARVDYVVSKATEDGGDFESRMDNYVIRDCCSVACCADRCADVRRGP
jgi:hypothetical protein